MQMAGQDECKQVGKSVQFPSCYTADLKWIYFVRCSLDISALFCSMSSSKIADMIRSARHSVCYAAPGVQLEVAKAMMMAGATLGREMLTVCLDFDERIMRMGYTYNWRSRMMAPVMS